RRPRPCYTRTSMPNTLLNYNLTDNFVQNWLAAGPFLQPFASETVSEAAVAEALAALHAPEHGLTEPPVDAAPFMGRKDAAWRYYRCGEDRLVDLTTSASQFSYVRAFAYA